MGVVIGAVGRHSEIIFRRDCAVVHGELRAFTGCCIDTCNIDARTLHADCADSAAVHRERSTIKHIDAATAICRAGNFGAGAAHCEACAVATDIDAPIREASNFAAAHGERAARDVDTNAAIGNRAAVHGERCAALVEYTDCRVVFAVISEFLAIVGGGGFNRGGSGGVVAAGAFFYGEGAIVDYSISRALNGAAADFRCAGIQDSIGNIVGVAGSETGSRSFDRAARHVKDCAAHSSYGISLGFEVAARKSERAFINVNKTGRLHII